MYLDLDPERWPSDANICNHSVASCFLEGQEQEGEAESETDGNVGFGEEHNIDEIRDVRIKYPLIDDADSSQHSALIDAVDGKSLVIEGPPGTGKSQTITNLIAAAMAAGKKVLFVAEKLAALEVVYRRLDKVGLSSFCLELHSHKTQKRKLIDEVNNRLAKHGTYREPTEIELDIKRYEELKSSLNTYAENINRIWKNTGYTLHKILTAAARYRGIVKIDLNDISPDGYDGEFYNPEVQRRNTDKLEVYREIYQSVTEQLEDGNSLQSHPWYGVKNDDLQIFDLDKIVQPLAAWQASLQQLNLKIEALAQMMDGKPGDIATTMSQLIHFVNKLEALPHLQGNELLKCLPDLRGDVLEKSQQYLALTQEIQELYTTLGARIDTDFLSNPEATNQLLTGGNRIKEWVQPNISMAHLNQTVSELLLFQERMESVHTMQKKVSATLGEPLSKYLIASKPGLIEFKRIIEFVSSISPSHWKNRDPMFDNEELDELLPQLQSEINELKKLHDTVSRIFDLSQLPAEKEIRQAQSLLAKGGFFKLFKKDWRMARKQVLLYTINAKTRLSDLLPALLDLANLVAKKKLVEDNPHYRETLGNWLQGLDTDFDTLQAMRGWYREIRRQYGFGFEKKAPLGDALIGLPPDIAKAIRSLKEQNVQDQIDDLVDRLDRLQEIFSPAVELHADGLLVGEQGIIPHLIDGLREAVQACGSLAEEDNLTAKNIGEFVEQISYLQHKVEEWQEDDIGQTPLGRQFGLQIGTNVDNTTSVSSLVNTLMLATHLETQLGNRILLSHIHGNCNPPTFSNLKEHAKSLRAEISNQDSCQKIFEESAQLNHRQWTHQCGEHLGQLITRNQVALENHEMLEPWLGYVRERNQIEESGLNKLAEAVETNRVAVSQIHDAYEAGIFNLLAKEVLSENPDLERVNGRKQESLQKQFGEYDQQIIKRQCERIAWKIDQTEVPTGNRGVRVSEHTEKALLEHECGKQTRHIPIRQLLERAGQALIALKPCFMMGPMSVAQYLAPGKIDFDLIVMDEASQIKPQDALGAIARGGQLVVVGDPKQLPPTSFFDKLSEEDEDPTVLAESESILDTARLMFPSRRLRWHYRSQHESLIAFSNQSFYNNDLILFPSPKKDAKTHGIQFSPIPRGCFVNQRNMEEARIISEAIREHFIHYPEETLGVVAMNSKQREQIEQAVETLEKEDETFKRRLDEDRTRHESLFVKNLENVQGDERDVIFISMTYGPQSLARGFSSVSDLSILMWAGGVSTCFSLAQENECTYSAQ